MSARDTRTRIAAEWGRNNCYVLDEGLEQRSSVHGELLCEHIDQLHHATHVLALHAPCFVHAQCGQLNRHLQAQMCVDERCRAVVQCVVHERCQGQMRASSVQVGVEDTTLQQCLVCRVVLLFEVTMLL